jgi:ricin-type beta-trefoil lectin protein
MKKTLVIAFLFLQKFVSGQQVLPVTDSMPAIDEGLKAGYEISGASEKEVGDKGNFSRFKLRFYVINTSNQAKLILLKPTNSIFSSTVSPELVRFKCSNATGARFTNKEATLAAKPCIVDALVDDADPSSGKTVQKKKPANIGYWIKPGETISSNCIMIVPLNERPNMTVTFFPNTGSMGGTVINNDNNFNNSQFANQRSANFVRIKNFATNSYLHNQDGPVACSAIDNNWWSAQWEMIPVSGTNYYQIRNRSKNNFITVENSNMLTDNGQSASAMWFIEEIGSTRTYSIKNAANNLSLVFQNGVLKTMTVLGTQSYAQWIIEQ